MRPVGQDVASAFGAAVIPGTGLNDKTRKEYRCEQPIDGQHHSLSTRAYQKKDSIGSRICFLKLTIVNYSNSAKSVCSRICFFNRFCVSKFRFQSMRELMTWLLYSRSLKTIVFPCFFQAPEAQCVGKPCVFLAF